ncbi:MFS transporter [Arthrobacter globiformis]|uniref:MFS transporter n=1 Tax=Arthrobacter globiformis TaxID=1665 RepID=UPI0027835664|nr:MFS transporter [Arthrobacter globiformis]MDQ0865088.1 MHS family proline/betaine transporter-like MFS transporter [Arthrobacter globiformis]
MNTNKIEGQISRKGLRTSVAAGSIGVFVHWFEWAIYAYLASTIAVVFFPQQDSTAALLSVFAVFAISFGVRPLGALVFGTLGDRIGRKKTLSIVILSMSAATLVVGLLPTYDAIGLWAPVLLVAARVVQGLAAGGEFGSAAAFLAEYSPRKHRGFGVSWLEFGSLLGFLAASLVVFVLTSVMDAQTIADGGWRIPFLIAVPMGIIGFYIRSKIEDTPEFRSLEQLDNIPQSPVKEVFTRHWKQLLQMSGLEIMMHVTFYVVLVYLLTYQEKVLGFDAGTAALLSTAASVAGLILVPLVGALSDRIGRKPLLIAAAISLVVLAYPLFLIMHSGTSWAGIVSTIGLGIILALILGVHAAAAAELFPTRTRQTGLSVAYSITAAIFAGTVPYVLTWLIAQTGNEMMPAFYLILVGLIGLAAVLSMKESNGKDLLGEEDIQTAPRHTAPAANTPIRH